MLSPGTAGSAVAQASEYSLMAVILSLQIVGRESIIFLSKLARAAKLVITSKVIQTTATSELSSTVLLESIQVLEKHYYQEA